MWYSDLTQGNGENLRMIVGVLWILTGIIATYMAAAITMLVMKGKPVLPLLISK
jgi:succinate-acetate transporter protein